MSATEAEFTSPYREVEGLVDLFREDPPMVVSYNVKEDLFQVELAPGEAFHLFLQLIEERGAPDPETSSPDPTSTPADYLRDSFARILYDSHMGTRTQ